MSNPNDKPVPDYDGQRNYLLPGGQPATRPIPIKPRPEPSPKLSDVDLSASLHGGLMKASRRMKLVESLNNFLIHNPDSLDAAAKFVEKLTSKSASGT